VSNSQSGSIELTIRPELKDLGEFTVRRVLPSPQRRMVGPFIFFDHMGPAEFPPGEGIAVRPHPHIGLATITYLFAGQIMHRDSLGHVQPIESGAVNLMTAGRGIVHSERAGDDLDTTSELHGIQSWMALPTDDEEVEPEFLHYPADSIPVTEVDGVAVRVIMGDAYGKSSPVKLFSPTLYLECRMPAGARLGLPGSHDELAAYVVEGRIRIDDQHYETGDMAIAAAGQSPHLVADTDSRVMVIGGSSLGKRHLYWNFVSSTRERIEQAKNDWREKRFDSVPGDDEFIPLPD
jgi:redox-sensitive bicupin YhaK (pirin superfamily)